MALQMLAAGMPMILMGDEVGRSQRGNNNAYCQDNEISWLDWSLLDRHRGLHRFVRHLCRMRSARDTGRGMFGVSLSDLLENTSIKWHGVKLNCPDWSDWSHCLAFELTGFRKSYVLYGILNAHSQGLSFELPTPNDAHWQRLIDTALPSPEDISVFAEAEPVTGQFYEAQPHSLVLLGHLLPAARDQ